MKKSIHDNGSRPAGWEHKIATAQELSKDDLDQIVADARHDPGLSTFWGVVIRQLIRKIRGLRDV